MTQYIDKTALVAEIKKIKSHIGSDKYLSDFEKGCNFGREDVCDSLLNFINTLEVKGVDLEKEIDNIWNPRFNLGWDEKTLLVMNHEGFTTIAKHFFELGLKVKENKL